MSGRVKAADDFDVIARRMRAIRRDEKRNPLDLFEEARREVAGAPISSSQVTVPAGSYEGYDGLGLMGFMGMGV